MKWKFLVVNEQYELFGTNDEKLAEQIAHFDIVINVEKGEEINYTLQGIRGLTQIPETHADDYQ